MGAGDDGPGRRLQADDAPRNGLRLHGHVVSGAEGTGRGPSFSDLRVLVIVCISDSGGTLRKLVITFQRVAEHAGRGVRRVRSVVAAPRGSRIIFSSVHGSDRE